MILGYLSTDINCYEKRTVFWKKRETFVITDHGLRFNSKKNQHFQIPIRYGILSSTVYHEPLVRVIAQAPPVFDIKLKFKSTSIYIYYSN